MSGPLVPAEGGKSVRIGACVYEGDRAIAGRRGSKLTLSWYDGCEWLGWLRMAENGWGWLGGRLRTNTGSDQ